MFINDPHYLHPDHPERRADGGIREHKGCGERDVREKGGNKMNPGDKVEFLDNDEEGHDHENEPEFYPKAGTNGVIQREDGDDGDGYWVKWPRGTTSGDDIWFAKRFMLKLVSEQK